MTWFNLTAEQILEYVGFLAVTAVVFVSGLGVVFAPRVLHAAVWLLFCLVGIAGYFALLGAHLLFAIQILVYAGAIAVMIVFAVLLLERGTGAGILAGSRHLFAGVVAAGGFLIIVLPSLVGPIVALGGLKLQPAAPTPEPDVAAIGRLFLTRHLLAFELISVVLLVAMIGAIVLSRPAMRERRPPEGDEGPDGAGEHEAIAEETQPAGEVAK
ncbi:MAG: NADH-quinone oxidoreductase subunit J [Armatimonadetes bacterium]|nr:NADH-quinone oxidoreductase subunit J [Armatimonadota bacterium]